MTIKCKPVPRYDDAQEMILAFREGFTAVPQVAWSSRETLSVKTLLETAILKQQQI